ncbi:MAG: hypothetical protein JWO32_1142 [Bacteroidetes bacterium]|nr:hypothetical protein [Bacteroidota bacterium]
MKKTILLINFFLIFTVSTSEAQFAKNFKKGWATAMQKLAESPWVFGLGWNIVDDNGKPWKKGFDAHNSWNIQGYPTTVRVEKFYDKGFSFVFNFAYNKYKAGKLINSEIPNATTTNFMSFDLNGKYNFCELYDINTKLFNFATPVFDPYATTGFGYTYRNTPRFGGAATYNIGLGLHSWIYKGFGVNLEVMAKFGLAGPFFRTPTNYTQYNFGIIYQLTEGISLHHKNQRRILKGM